MEPFPFTYIINILHYKIIIVWYPDIIDLGALISYIFWKQWNRKCQKSRVLLSVTIDTIGKISYYYYHYRYRWKMDFWSSLVSSWLFTLIFLLLRKTKTLLHTNYAPTKTNARCGLGISPFEQFGLIGCASTEAPSGNSIYPYP